VIEFRVGGLEEFIVDDVEEVGGGVETGGWRWCRLNHRRITGGARGGGAKSSEEEAEEDMRRAGEDDRAEAREEEALQRGVIT
jgi:hypothetical protein